VIGAEAKVSGNASGLTVAGAKTRCCWKDLSLIGRLQCVVLDCPDVWELAQFYQSLLGGVVNQPDPRWAVSDDFSTLHTGSSLVFVFQRVKDYRAPRWPDTASPNSFTSMSTSLTSITPRIRYSALVPCCYTSTHAAGGSSQTRQAIRSACSGVDVAGLHCPQHGPSRPRVRDSSVAVTD